MRDLEGKGWAAMVPDLSWFGLCKTDIANGFSFITFSFDGSSPVMGSGILLLKDLM